MNKTLQACTALLLACTINANAQSFNNKNVERYIDRYRSLAMSEQQRTGIPAAIKLAQGIHETGAGTSKLATEANNHFGLKCKAGWTGGTYAYTDDRPNECFRKYNLDFESFQDQSNYLKNSPRYASLFNLSVTDYAAWAIGLRKAGYATNPKYSEMLIKIIEDYRLQEYTYAAMGNSSLNSDNIAAAPAEEEYVAPQATNTTAYNNAQKQPAQYNTQATTYGNTQPVAAATTAPVTAVPAPTPVAKVETINTAPPDRTSKYIDTRPRERQTVTQTQQNGQTVEQPTDNGSFNVSKVNNLKAVHGKKGDMPLQYAVRNGIRYEKFLEINDLKEEPLPADMPLYLERKHFWGIKSMHLVKPGETMLVISQKEGIQLKYLRDLNYIEEGEEPMPGVTLELQAQAGAKPPVMAGNEVASYSQNTENAYAPPVRNFPKNPAPPHEEEKPLWVKMKEARQARKDAKAPAASAASAPAPASIQSAQPTYQQAQQTATANNVRPNPAAQTYGTTSRTANTVPTQRGASTQQAASTPQATQQPMESHSRTQYSYHTTGNVKPNPAAQVVEEEEEKPSRESRRNRRKEEEQPQVANTTKPVQQPKTELDALKEQFDNVIYAQNTPAQPQQKQATAYQQPRTQQTAPQQTVSQPVSQAQKATADASKIYTVKRGDTAYTIAKKHGITIRQLMDWNGLDFDAIKEGQNLRVKP